MIINKPLEMNKIIFAKMPMPPSENEQYWARPFMRNGKMMACITKSVKLQNYQEIIFEAWKLKNAKSIELAKKTIQNWLLMDNMIRIDTYVCFPKDSLWYKNENPKRNDVKNRLKALHDCLSTVLGINDCMFWNGYDEKLETSESEPWSFVVLSPFKPRKIEQLRIDDL